MSPMRKPVMRTSLVTMLDRYRDQYDRMMGELHGGIRDQRHYDDLEERAQAIAEGIVSAFRCGRR